MGKKNSKKTNEDIPKEYRLAKDLPKDVRYYYETKVGIPDLSQNYLELFSPGVVAHLFRIMHSCSDNTKKAKEVERYLDPFGFKMLGEGTNIVVLTNDIYPGVVFKIALDPYGIADNFNDLNFCQTIPRYAKVFARDHTCIVTVQERYYVMDLDLIGYYREPIIKFLNQLKDKYLIADLSPKNILNYGIDRKGRFVIIDGSDLFPLSQIKGKELRCNRVVKYGKKNKPDVLCGGKIVYNDDFSECICKKCKRVTIPISLRPRKEVEKLSRMLLDGTTEEEREEMNRKVKAAIKARLAVTKASPSRREEQRNSVEPVEVQIDPDLDLEIKQDDPVMIEEEPKAVTKERPSVSFSVFQKKEVEGEVIPEEPEDEEDQDDTNEEPEEAEIGKLEDDPIIAKTIIRSKSKKVEHEEPLVVKVHEDSPNTEDDPDEEERQEVVMGLLREFTKLGGKVEILQKEEEEADQVYEDNEPEDTEEDEDEEDEIQRGEDGFFHLNIREALAKKREQEKKKETTIDKQLVEVEQAEPEVATQAEETVPDDQKQDGMSPSFKEKLQTIRETSPMLFRNYITEMIRTVGIDYVEDVVAELKGLSAEDVIEVETDHVASEDPNNDILDPNDSRIEFKVVTMQNRSSDELPGIYYHIIGDFDMAYQKCGLPIYVTSDRTKPTSAVLVIGSEPSLRETVEEAYIELLSGDDTTFRELVDNEEDEYGDEDDPLYYSYPSTSKLVDESHIDDEYEPDWARKADMLDDEDEEEEDTSDPDES